MKNISILFFLMLLFSCNKNETEYFNYQRSADSDINIFLVKEGQVEYSDTSVNIETLDLEDEPWVKDDDILFYDWSSQSFYLRKSVEKSKYSGRNFMVTSGEKRLLMGIFFPMYMSSLPVFPSITPEDGLFSPPDVVSFSRFGYFQPGNLKEKTEFKEELVDAGVLREGIEVEIQELKRINSETLSYTYKVSNRDPENIYILDSKKMGADRFHYFTNGVSLIKENNYYWPHNFETTASEEIKSEWYHKLEPGESLTRTVSLSGYSDLPSGKVEATFNFPGSNLNKEGEWKVSDGRIWLGNCSDQRELTVR